MQKQKKGFAVIDPAKQRAIASKGGKRAHEIGRAHEFTSEEASAAGKIGGRRSAESRRQKSLAKQGG